ncbi:MAG: sigma 54-interacting transcriptional regulator, partial [Desulfarculus sp.]|nr:sigma 54-interacting transcriptional regulator [Desulfarculus sp.]
ISVDVRVLAATNKDLQREMAAGRFREDLFYRLNVIPIHVPPLRERSGDVPELAADFLGHLAIKHNQPVKRFTPQALEVLKTQPWPGNVRELKNLVERMWILCPDREIGLDDLPPEISGAAVPAGPPPELFAGDFKNAKAAFEKAYLESKLHENQGNVSRTAEEVGLERSHLHKKLKNLGIKAGNGD